MTISRSTVYPYSWVKNNLYAFSTVIVYLSPQKSNGTKPQTNVVF